MNSRIHKPSRIFWLLLALCTFGVALVSLGVGRFPISPVKTGGILLSSFASISPFWEPREEAIVTLIRLPRILGALGAGAGLSVAGAALQGIFRNPLVGPQIIGV
ncbi:MAG TPA: iron chelate uptake ABC transporter family permease subunit, partial [Synergistaceae bacterium]|nr:iron chelate uptake ABC transporter family permease subunit [Synergistaceae bacterium]